MEWTGLSLQEQQARGQAVLVFDLAHPRDGLSIADAAIDGALNRFRPILMTSLSVMGGMIASTCLAVLFVPAFFC